MIRRSHFVSSPLFLCFVICSVRNIVLAQGTSIFSLIVDPTRHFVSSSLFKPPEFYLQLHPSVDGSICLRIRNQLRTHLGPQRRISSRARPRLPNRHQCRNLPGHKPPRQTVPRILIQLQCLQFYVVSNNIFFLNLIYIQLIFFSGDRPVEETSSGHTKRE